MSCVEIFEDKTSECVAGGQLRVESPSRLREETRSYVQGFWLHSIC